MGGRGSEAPRGLRGGWLLLAFFHVDYLAALGVALSADNEQVTGSTDRGAAFGTLVFSGRRWGFCGRCRGGRGVTRTRRGKGEGGAFLAFQENFR